MTNASTPQSRNVAGSRVGPAFMSFFALMAVVVLTSQTPANGDSGDQSIKGTGTINSVAKFLGKRTIGNSAIWETGGNVGIGTITPQARLDVLGNMRIEGLGSALIFPDGSAVHNRAELVGPQGPLGQQGPQGVPGPSGINHAYTGSSEKIEIDSSDIDHLTQVAAITVPAGTYLLFGKTTIQAVDPSSGTEALCAISQGDDGQTSLSVESVAMLALQDVKTFTQTTAITMGCVTGKVAFARNSRLTAIAVDAVN